jgi:chromosome segregation ATPase
VLLKGIKDSEKVAVGALRTVLQTWLTLELSGISERLGRIEERLDAHDHRFDGIEWRLDGIERQLVTMGDRLTRVESRLDRAEERLNMVDKRLAASDEWLGHLEQHFTESDVKLTIIDERVVSFRNETHSKFATVHSEIPHLQQVSDLRERLASVETKLEARHD